MILLASLMSSIPPWGWLDMAFTLMVLAGVCGESDWVAKLIIPEELNGLLPIELKRKVLKKWAERLLIFGIAGEVLCLSFSLAESANTTKQAAVANERAGVLESNNLVLRSNVVMLESALAWRTINPTQETNLINF